MVKSGKPRGKGKGKGKDKDKGKKVAKCRFCKQGIRKVDYKDVNTLRKMTSGQGKIHSRFRSGNCAKHQRSVKQAIARARYLALLPYVGGA